MMCVNFVSAPLSRTRTSAHAQAKKVNANKKEPDPALTPLYLDTLTTVATAIQCDLKVPQDGYHNYERAPFHLVCENPSEDAPAVLAEMLKREPSGATQLDASQRLPLHVAAANSSESAARLVEYLVKAFSGGCLVRDKTGRLPIHYAASNSGPNAHIMAAMLVEAYPECCEWPTVPLSAVHIAAAPAGHGCVPTLSAGAFAIIEVPEGGGSVRLPELEDGATVVVAVRPQDREAPLVLTAPDGAVIYDAVDGVQSKDFVMSAPVDLVLQFCSCSTRGQWKVTRSRVSEFPTELALKNEGPCSGEMLTCLLSSKPSLALIRDDAGGRLLHRLVASFVERQSLYHEHGSFESEGADIGCACLSQLLGCLSCVPSLATFTDVRGATPLHLFSKLSLSYLRDTVNVLMRHRPESAWQGDIDGNTPLHLAVAADNYNVTHVLISRSDVERANLIANTLGQYPSDLATTRQMRRLLVSSAADRKNSIVFMSVCNAVYFWLLVFLFVENAARGDMTFAWLTIMGPVLWALETSWEDVSRGDMSGDEKMVNLAITAVGMRVPWEGFRFIFPHHYLSRFACLENARGWQRNRLFTLKQIESFLSLFPQAIVQGCSIIQRDDASDSVLQIIMLVMCLVMYAHTSTSQDSCEFGIMDCQQVVHKVVIFVLRFSELMQRVCSMVLLLMCPLWRVAVLLFVGEGLCCLANWTRLQRKRIQEISFQMLMSSGMNLVGVWEGNPFGDGLNEILLGPDSNKRRFLGEKSVRSALGAAIPRVMMNATMTLVYALYTGSEFLSPGPADTDTVFEGLVIASMLIYGFMLAAHYKLHCMLMSQIDKMAAQAVKELKEDGPLSKIVGQVQIRVIRARDLMDRVTGIPDPYCEVKLGLDMERTESPHNTLNPKWEEELVLYVQARHLNELRENSMKHAPQVLTTCGLTHQLSYTGDKESKIDSSLRDPSNCVTFSVKDADFLSSLDNTLGTCSIPLEHLLHIQPEEEVWLQLDNPRIPQALQQGQVLACMRLVLWETEESSATTHNVMGGGAVRRGMQDFDFASQRELDANLSALSYPTEGHASPGEAPQDIVIAVAESPASAQQVQERGCDLEMPPGAPHQVAGIFDSSSTRSGLKKEKRGSDSREESSGSAVGEEGGKWQQGTADSVHTNAAEPVREHGHQSALSGALRGLKDRARHKIDKRGPGEVAENVRARDAGVVVDPETADGEAPGTSRVAKSEDDRTLGACPTSSDSH